ncbi:sensor histidine kinase [Flexithrix dorotheae]|uniref:sensor histidine kinase n=1 Tax=Flexithrix dorotheae TaxID=70993 RepID=UPI0003634811|nr:sensor histidine kinase [Flexithrix dorotheae]
MKLKITEIGIRYQEDVIFTLKSIREFAKSAGLSQYNITKFVTAISEVCRNVLLHQNGGILELNIITAKKKQYLEAIIRDFGRDEFDFSEVLENVAGPDGKDGLGLEGSQKLVEYVDIEKSDEGTVITLRKILPEGGQVVDSHTISSWEKHIEKEINFSPLQDLKRKNQKLQEAYETIKNNEKSLAAANAKLQAMVIQMEEKNEELRNFAHVVSHDLKSPLNVVFTAGEMINSFYKDDLTEETAEMFDMILRAGKNMKKLINDYLDYATSSAHEDVQEEIDLNELTKEVIELISSPKKVEFKVEDLPSVSYDKVAMQQVLTNLITNGIKYCDKELVKINISAEENAKGVIVKIADNGPGIDKQYHEDIFNLYRTVGKKLNSVEKGTGLGLPLVKKIAQRNRGKVWLESEIGKGSTFFFLVWK